MREGVLQLCEGDHRRLDRYVNLSLLLSHLTKDQAERLDMICLCWRDCETD
jgi:hypothetical protein